HSLPKYKDELFSNLLLLVHPLCTLGYRGHYLIFRQFISDIECLIFVIHSTLRNGRDLDVETPFGPISLGKSIVLLLIPWPKCGCLVTHIWKNLTQARDKAEVNMKWIIQNGSSSFWWDNWTGFGAIAKYCPNQSHSIRIRVHNFINNQEWDIQRLQQFLPMWLPQHITTLKIGIMEK
ncbi:hypothetical protein H5410_005007, partial [Solanum commersonii]